ncbi:butyrophilin subfamily 1 member A1-like [Nycticebus coucang]|uniref:butyrophilin subfamily 1 member A1-like n=1 Tax=Nycticebus coucang TaxID=9470 RepID=UPI00234E0A03|nr:butyrophilin subfamily 1 member A1-like [Nycticebus coucang]
MAMGKAAVRIHNVIALDNGTYWCLFKEGNVSSRAALQLQVAGLGSEPTIKVTEDQHGGVRAECTSEGWYPEPQVEWTDSTGKVIVSVPNLSASNTTGLWAVVSNVSIEDRTVESVSCSISSPLLPETKVAKTRLPDFFFRRSPLMVWTIAVPLILAAVGLIIALVICLFWKRKREKNRKSLEEEREQREEEQRQQDSGDKVLPLSAVSPSLDPDTASPKLSLSEDWKSVRRLRFAQDVAPSPGRFDRDPCVLAHEQFSTGRYCWEVEVGERGAWILGVCLEGIGRKGWIPKSPQNGFWALELHKRRYRALSYPRTRLYPSRPLRQVGVFLDCDKGEVSFHNVTDGSQVYQFSGLSLLQPLKPFLCLWTHDSHPVTFCPVVREMHDETDWPPWRPKIAPLETSGLPQGTPIKEKAASSSINRDTLQTRLTFSSPETTSSPGETPSP